VAQVSDGSLPDGMSACDLPGCSEEDVFVDNYVDNNYTPEMYVEFMRALTKGRIEDLPLPWAKEFFDWEVMSDSFRDWLEERGRSEF